jgi:hypothetical protein
MMGTNGYRNIAKNGAKAALARHKQPAAKKRFELRAGKTPKVGKRTAKRSPVSALGTSPKRHSPRTTESPGSWGIIAA